MPTAPVKIFINFYELVAGVLDLTQYEHEDRMEFGRVINVVAIDR